VSKRLADGRPYLTGDRFTAADLTFAALAAPVLAPPAFARYVGALDRAPAGFRDMVAGHRTTSAGAFVMRVYQRDRDARVRVASSAA